MGDERVESRDEAKQKLEKNLKEIFSEAKLRKENKEDSKHIFDDLSLKIKNVIVKYHESLKMPADREFARKQNEKLMNILKVM